MILMNRPKRSRKFEPKSDLLEKILCVLSVTIILVAILLLSIGCIEVKKGAVTLFPEPKGANLKSPHVSNPDVPMWQDPEILAILASTVGIIGHRIYSQKKGSYNK